MSRTDVNERAETRLLQQLGAPRRDNAGLIDAIQGLEGPRALELARRHNLLQVLALAALRGDADVDPGTRDVFRRIARAAAYSDRLGVVVLREALNAAAEHGIEPMVIKGPALAERYWSDPTERGSVDLDLLVRIEQRAEMERALVGLGYEPVDRERYERTHFHLPFVHRSRTHRNVIEVHWDLSPQQSSVRYDVEGWWQRASRHPLRGGTALTPHPTDELSHLCWHAFNHGAATVRDLSDIARVWLACRETLDIDRLVNTARRTGTGRFLRTALELVAALWGDEEGSADVAARLPRGRWVARNLHRMPTVVASGSGLWWPYRQIGYWSLLARGGWSTLVRRTLRDVRDSLGDPGTNGDRFKDLQALGTLAYAVGSCAVTTRPDRWAGVLHDVEPGPGST